MKYIILMNDGACFSVNSENRNDAILEVWQKYDVPYEDFIVDVNMVEWFEDGIFHLKNYNTGMTEFNNSSKLTRFLNIKEVKPKQTEIEEEYDEFYGE